MKNGLTTENPQSSRIISFIFQPRVVPPADPLF
jgi:hypothetical protein